MFIPLITSLSFFIVLAPIPYARPATTPPMNMKETIPLRNGDLRMLNVLGSRKNPFSGIIPSAITALKIITANAAYHKPLFSSLDKGLISSASTEPL